MSCFSDRRVSLSFSFNFYFRREFMCGTCRTGAYFAATKGSPRATTVSPPLMGESMTVSWLVVVKVKIDIILKSSVIIIPLCVLCPF